LFLKTSTGSLRLNDNLTRRRQARLNALAPST
jgi:hypothetical protein